MSFDSNVLKNEPHPVWEIRPWGRPVIHMVESEVNKNLVGTAQFNYHGLKIQGVRIYRNDEGFLSVSMPQKRFGDMLESVLFFQDPLERDRFEHDVAWLWQAIFGRAYAKRQSKN